MNPRAPQTRVNFGEVPIKDVFDLKGFNLNAKLDIDPDFLKEAEHGHDHDHEGHDHEHGEHCDHPHHHAHDDDVKSFVFRADKAFDAGKLEDFLGAIVQVYGPKMLRYKGVLNMKGSDRKVIFQGVHQLIGERSRAEWAPGEKKGSEMVFMGIDLPQDILKQGLEQCLVSRLRRRTVAARIEPLTTARRRCSTPLLDAGRDPGRGRDYNPRRSKTVAPFATRLAREGRAAVARRTREETNRQEDSEEGRRRTSAGTPHREESRAEAGEDGQRQGRAGRQEEVRPGQEAGHG